MIILGTLCKRKHDDAGGSLRYSNGACIKCAKLLANKWKKDNPILSKEVNKKSSAKNYIREKETSRRYRIIHKDTIVKKVKDWVTANPDRRKLIAKRSHIKHKELRNALSRKWAANNKEHKQLYDKEYRIANLGKMNAKYTRRKIAKFQASPKWANEFFIEEIYDLAKLREKYTGIKWHVDHIVPLKHSLVCGLHVEHNLQVIPAAENLKKSNNFVVG